MATHIHPTAIVSPDAQLDDDVVVGPYCIVDGDVTIGAGSHLRALARIYRYTTLGQGCTVYEGAVIGPEPQDLGFKGEKSFVTIGDNTVLRENVTIHRGSGEGTTTSVGDDCLIMEGVHLGHNVTVGNKVIIASKSGLAGYAAVGYGTVIGGMSGVHQFVRIGRYCMVGGASKNTLDIPPFTLVSGHSSRIYSLNTIGLRRNGFDAQTRSLIKKAYKQIYHSGLLLNDALDELERQNGSNEYVCEIVQFYRSADRKRGVCSWPRNGKSEEL